MNSHLINNLCILQKYYEHTHDHFRKYAYENAIRSISKLNFEIKDEKQVKNMTGIGSGIFKKIKEFIQTGHISKVEDVRSIIETTGYKQKVLKRFLNIWGVGDVKANDLWNKGFRNVNELKKNSHTLNRSQLIGLKYYDDLLERIPRKNMNLYQAVFIYVLNKEFGKGTYTLEVAGSYRRGAESSGDMDVLLTSRVFALHDVVNILIKYHFITDTLSMRNEKFMGIAHFPRSNDPHFRLDIEFVPAEQFPFALLYFTTPAS